MIKAEHKWWARLIFNPYTDRLLKKNFGNFYLVNDLPDLDNSAGLIITPNHFSWWDGFIVDFISRKLIKRKIHVMMLEEQLNRYWFFNKVGAYSINITNPVSMVKTLHYTRDIAGSNENFVVLFPQGKIQSLNEKSVSIKEGLKVLLDTVKFELYVLPMAVKFEYGNNKNPDIVVRFGRQLKATEIKSDFEVFAGEFTRNLESLKTTTKIEAFKNIFKI